ncbi:hypothetical protein CK203_053194 [Vitis vinifera]|uniref:Uncharacterized protein n=1 Tax=Vitis vinifera TaxID=29760 RepID=A0A438GP58_VITVI|nr:hypothetical protein CK203_053194 [Vitis vinifera]
MLSPGTFRGSSNFHANQGGFRGRSFGGSGRGGENNVNNLMTKSEFTGQNRLFMDNGTGLQAGSNGREDLSLVCKRLMIPMSRFLQSNHNLIPRKSFQCKQCSSSQLMFRFL